MTRNTYQSGTTWQYPVPHFHRAIRLRPRMHAKRAAIPRQPFIPSYAACMSPYRSGHRPPIYSPSHTSLHIARRSQPCEVRSARPPTVIEFWQRAISQQCSSIQALDVNHCMRSAYYSSGTAYTMLTITDRSKSSFLRGRGSRSTTCDSDAMSRYFWRSYIWLATPSSSTTRVTFRFNARWARARMHASLPRTVQSFCTRHFISIRSSRNFDLHYNGLFMHMATWSSGDLATPKSPSFPIPKSRR